MIDDSEYDAIDIKKQMNGGTDIVFDIVLNYATKKDGGLK